MKHFSTKVSILAAAVLAVGVVFGLMLSGSNSGRVGASQCGHKSQLYIIEIKDGRASPENTDAHLCDKLKFINKDIQLHEIGFGPHDEHVPYDGIVSKVIRQNESFTVNLNEAGLYHFHDHLDHSSEGYFYVSK